MKAKLKLNDWIKAQAPQGRIGNLDPVIPIGTAARLVNLSESALRKYEAEGLIKYHRTEGNYRMLSIEDIERLRMIKSLVKDKGLNLEGIRRLWSLIPCWELKDCSEEIYRNCAVRLDSDQPCWVVRSHADICGGTECRECAVYRFGAHCTEDLKALVHSRFCQSQSGERG
ncbi:MerR family transcriptional regulator [Calditrichota bacterium]